MVSWRSIRKHYVFPPILLEVILIEEVSLMIVKTWTAKRKLGKIKREKKVKLLLKIILKHISWVTNEIISKHFCLYWDIIFSAGFISSYFSLKNTSFKNKVGPRICPTCFVSWEKNLCINLDSVHVPMERTNNYDFKFCSTPLL